jgi:hypothetical protein
MTAVSISPIYVHKEKSDFYVTESRLANSDRYYCWIVDRKRTASVFTWEELLAVLREDYRLKDRKIVPMF